MVAARVLNDIFATFAPQIAERMEQGDYSIPLRQLPNGNHSFSFDCGNDLFSRIEGALAEHGKLHVDVEARKTDEMIVLDFDINGTVEQQCALCLGTLDYPIEDCGERITVKLGDKEAELDDDLYEVDATDERLDLAQWIYEQVCVTLPIRCEHPLDEDGNPTCDPAMLQELDKYIVHSNEDIRRKAREAQGEEFDPRWKALEGLKNKEQ